ncbi:MAG: hypothetical protein WCW68_00865 [Methanothrix sp.]|jgi:hypothetical protein
MKERGLMARGWQDATPRGAVRKMYAEAARQKVWERKAEALGIGRMASVVSDYCIMLNVLADIRILQP